MKMSFLRRLCAVIIGITFLVSGLAKIIDPVGTMLIVTEYFKLLHLSFLAPAAKVLGVILATLEAITGLALITGVLRKIAAWITYLMVGFFTLVTLFLLIKNPSMDCGCFGEAIHLNHLQSFLKNIALVALACIAFIPLKSIGRPKSRKWVSFGIATLSVLYAVLYSNTHIPIVDFTEFNFGAELMASLDDDVEADNHYQTMYVYEKDGQEGIFPDGNKPVSDTAWTLVRVDTLFRQGIGMQEQHPILSFRNAEGEYLDDEAAQGKVVVFSVYDPAKANWERLHKQFNQALEGGARPILMVASYPAEIDTFGIPAELPVHYADYKTLITLNRSNGGATYLCEGEIIGKWHQREFPASIASMLKQDPVDLSSTLILNRRIKAQGFALYLIALLIFV